MVEDNVVPLKSTRKQPNSDRFIHFLVRKSDLRTEGSGKISQNYVNFRSVLTISYFFFNKQKFLYSLIEYEKISEEVFSNETEFQIL